MFSNLLTGNNSNTTDNLSITCSLESFKPNIKGTCGFERIISRLKKNDTQKKKEKKKKKKRYPDPVSVPSKLDVRFWAGQCNSVLLSFLYGLYCDTALGT